MSFHTKVFAKWVLTGEHAVLRGGRAITLPHPRLFLEATFEQGERLEVFPPELDHSVRRLLNVLREACRSEEKLLMGRISFENSVPIGSGLGSSAALCVAVVRSFLPDASGGRVFELARQMEDEFHGQSSGMDVAAVAAKEALEYSSNQGGRPLGLKRLPSFKFHDTGLRASTKDCVERVNRWRGENSAEADALDAKMSQCTDRALMGLQQYDRGESASGLERIASAMNEAQDCFRGWGLLTPEIEQQATAIREKGAIAVKLTGAGLGGFLVSLWKK